MRLQGKSVPMKEQAMRQHSAVLMLILSAFPFPQEQNRPGQVVENLRIWDIG